MLGDSSQSGAGAQDAIVIERSFPAQIPEPYKLYFVPVFNII